LPHIEPLDALALEGEGKELARARRHLDVLALEERRKKKEKPYKSVSNVVWFGKYFT